MSMKELRERRGLSQVQIADRLAVDKSTVSKWESGDSTPLKKYRPQLCELLGCTEEELIAPASA